MDIFTQLLCVVALLWMAAMLLLHQQYALLLEVRAILHEMELKEKEKLDAELEIKKLNATLLEIKCLH